MPVNRGSATRSPLQQLMACLISASSRARPAHEHAAHHRLGALAGAGPKRDCIGSTLPFLSNIGGVLIYALDGAEQLEGYAAADWVISDLVRMECLVGPLRTADQIRLLAIRSFSCIRS